MEDSRPNETLTEPEPPVPTRGGADAVAGRRTEVQSAAKRSNGAVMHAVAQGDAPGAEPTPGNQSGGGGGAPPSSPFASVEELAKKFHKTLGWDGLNSWGEHADDHPDVLKCRELANVAWPTIARLQGELEEAKVRINALEIVHTAACDGDESCPACDALRRQGRNS